MFQKLLNLFRKKPKAEEALIRSQQFNRSQPKKPAGVSIPVPPKRHEVSTAARAPEPARRSEPARDPAPDFYASMADSSPSDRSYSGCSSSSYSSSDSSSSCSSSSSGD